MSDKFLEAMEYGYDAYSAGTIWEEGLHRATLPKTCKRCGKSNLKWAIRDQFSGKLAWTLIDKDTGEIHVCSMSKFTSL